MLSRSGSDVSPRAYKRLHRSKSASSVQERKKNPIISEPLDPETSRLHALIAAHRAMERSSERTSEELRRSGSSASKRPVKEPLKERTGNNGEHVKFSPATEWRRQRIGMPPGITRNPTASVASSAPQAPTEISDTYFEQYQYSPSVPASEFGRVSSESYGAEPSSYRRLRKVKSTLNAPRNAMSIQNLGSRAQRISPPKTLRSANSSLGISERNRLGSKLKRSMSFLRSSGVNTHNASKSPAEEQRCSEEAVQMARDHFLKEFEEQRLKQKSSTLFNPKVRRNKIFRKSVRTSAVTMFGNGVKSDHQEVTIQSSGSKIRTLSASLRDRVRGLFGKTPVGKDRLPPQQLTAGRRHFGDHGDGPDAKDHGFDAYQTGDEAESARRSSIYVTPHGDSEAFEDLDKMPDTLQMAESQESLHSAARSRVTSWTNSTVTGTGSLHAMPLEAKRLSIIKEDGGPYQPSSSAGRHIGGISVFQEPIDNSAVDSQRIYSALMRRIDHEHAEMDRTERELEKIHQEQEQADRQGLRNIPTIRTVQSEASLRTVQHAPDPEHREFSLGKPDWHSYSQDEIHISDNGMTPEQHKENVEIRRAKLAAQEAQSSFFPFSGSGEKPKGHSPFRQALMENRREDITATEESERAENHTAEPGDSELVLHFRPATRGKDGGTGSAGRLALDRSAMMSAESIYSRTTCGGRNEAYVTPVGSSEELGLPCIPGRECSGGMATILPSRINRYPRASERVGRLMARHNSSASTRTSESQQWRGWMERELGSVGGISSRLERQQSRSSEKSAIGGQGHVREHAQIDEEDVEVGNGDDEMGKMQKRFPLLELKEVSRGNTPVPKQDGGGRGLVKSQSGLLLKKTSMNNLGGNDENKKLGASGLRRISPGNMAKMLRGKGGGLFGSGSSAVSAGKENKTPTPSPGGGESERGSINPRGKKDSPDSSPPVSTPGRLAMMGGKSSNGRLRSKRSKPEGQQVTPTGRRKKLKYKFDDSKNSPASSSTGRNNRSSSRSGSGSEKSSEGKLKRLVPLSARLSGPSDSTCLGGKGKDVWQTSAGTTGVVGLSVAPPSGFGDTQRGVGGYGGLGVEVGGGPAAVRMATMKLDGSGVETDDGSAEKVSDEPTDTPTPTPAGVKGIGVKLSSKRMVSDFLRRRRWGGGGSGSSTAGLLEGGKEAVREGTGSPAFL